MSLTFQDHELSDSLAQPTGEQIRAVLAAWDAAVA